MWRDLAAEEIKNITARIVKVWSRTNYYWYPLAPCARSDVLSLVLSKFERIVSTRILQEVFYQQGIIKIYWVREVEQSQVVEVENLSLYEPESFLCDDSMSWIIYISHENSITFGGHWLIEKLKDICPEWEQIMWR